VRSLLDAWKEPGIYQVRWDGRDDDGRQVASGVYFYSLVTADERVTRKMVLVR
jgi:flagellar hook assembly protein FlgD